MGIYFHPSFGYFLEYSVLNGIHPLQLRTEKRRQIYTIGRVLLLRLFDFVANSACALAPGVIAFRRARSLRGLSTNLSLA